MTDAMTGPWLIVKWVGLGVTLCYMALFVVAMWRFRGRLHRIRSTATLPIVLGNFVLLIPPWLFMKAEVTRACFVVAQLIFIYGMAVLVKGVAKDEAGLLKADS